RALERVHQIRHSDNIEGWLCTIMRSIFFSACRYKKHRLELLHRNGHTFDQVIMPDSYVQERELRTMVNELPEDRARMLLMFFEGYKYDEIAEDQGLKMGTVKN